MTSNSVAIVTGASQGIGRATAVHIEKSVFLSFHTLTDIQC